MSDSQALIIHNKSVDMNMFRFKGKKVAEPNIKEEEAFTFHCSLFILPMHFIIFLYNT